MHSTYFQTVRKKGDYFEDTCEYTLMIYSHLRFARHELLHELFSPCNHKKWVHNPLLNFSIHVKVDQIASVNMPT